MDSSEQHHVTNLAQIHAKRGSGMIVLNANAFATCMLIKSHLDRPLYVHVLQHCTFSFNVPTGLCGSGTETGTRGGGCSCVGG
eukprot:1141473-Pelagomonas_calceolata.AAC.2